MRNHEQTNGSKHLENHPLSPHAQILPQQDTSLIGRERELAAIEQAFQDSTCHLLTLVGLGGIGKTHLASEAGVRLADRFTHASCFVPLSSIASPALIVPTVASALGYYFHGSEPPQMQLLNFLRQRDMLLILDNFEHLIEGIDLLIEIIHAAPGVRLLVTSRERLNVREEWVLDIAGLDYPPDEHVGEIEAYSAIQLFLQSARHAKADFRLTTANQASVIRICHLVEGMPLGIELAASWLRVLTCSAIANEIERSFDFLSSNLRNVPEKHRSMRAVFAHSYHMLTTEQQRIFCRLSVFRGGFTREAAAAVAGATLNALSELVDRSLLRMSADGRYDMHELLRQYAEARLEESGDGGVVQRVHSVYYGAFIDHRIADLKGRRQIEAMAEITADFENVRTAWNWAASQQHVDTLLQMVDGLWVYAYVRHRQPEVEALIHDAKTQLTDKRGANGERLWGRLLARSKQGSDYQAQLETALQIARRYNDLHEVALCLSYLAYVYYDNRDFYKAKQLLEESLAICRQLDAPYLLAEVLFNISSQSYKGTWGDFKRYGEESIRIRRAIGDQVGIAWGLAVEATAHARDGNFAAAEHAWMERADLGQKLGNLHLICLAHAHASYQVYFIQGAFDKARASAEETLRIAHSHQYTGPVGYALTTLGLLNCMEGRYQEGKSLCERAAAAKGLAWVADLAAWGLCISAYGLGDMDAAKAYLPDAFKFLDKFCGLPGILSTIFIRAAIAAREGNSIQAVEWLALSTTHPVFPSGWMQKWEMFERVKMMLEQSLDPPTYAAAWERGKRMNADQMGTEFKIAQPSAEAEANGLIAEGLTKRELEILQLMADGMSNKAIAEHLVLAPNTVKWYVSEILSKLHATSRTQAVSRARLLKLLP